MSFGEADLRRLGEQIQVHRKRITELDEAIESLKEERWLHQKILEIVADAGVIEILGKIVDDREAAVEAARDVSSFCAEHGVALPDGFIAAVSLGTDDGRASVKVRRDGSRFGANLSWDSDRGFDGRVFRIRSRSGGK